MSDGGEPGDAIGSGLVEVLIARAADLPESARERLLARAEVLRAHYAGRTPIEAPPITPRDTSDDEAWRALVEARRRARPPRRRTEGAARAVMAEIRASAATARAADRVPEAAGPYNGAAVAARVLEELAALAPGYLGAYVAWLDDLGALTELPDRKPTRR